MRYDQPSTSTTSKTTEEVIDQTVAGLQDAARQAATHGREAAEGVREVASTFAEAFDESLRNRPLATVGMVAAAGFVLGALWKS